MNSAQRIIKYFGIALAFVLIALIFNLLFRSFLIIGGLFNDNVDDTFKEVLRLDDGVSALDAELDFSSLEIRVGNTFKVETNSSDIDVVNEGQKVKIVDNKVLSFSKSNSRKVVVYVKDDARFSLINIDTGVGNVDIDVLNGKRISLDFGVSNAIINEMHADNVEIDAGVGSLTIKNGVLNNLDFDLGVGKADVSAKITGVNKIDAGIGKLNLNLIGNENDYKLKFSKGIGAITFDGISAKDGDAFGDGLNEIMVDGGIGEISVNVLNR